MYQKKKYQTMMSKPRTENRNKRATRLVLVVTPFIFIILVLLTLFRNTLSLIMPKYLGTSWNRVSLKVQRAHAVTPTLTCTVRLVKSLDKLFCQLIAVKTCHCTTHLTGWVSRCEPPPGNYPTGLYSHCPGMIQ